MDKRIGCNSCPLCHVEVDTLCEQYCSDMADYIEEVRADAIDDFQEWLKTQVVGVDNTTKEILVVKGDRWELAIDVYKENEKKSEDI